jgi:type IX secretion system PorP/SprF family membrane protein
LFVALFVFSFSAKAQDLHFSQYFASPLMQNPANTGLFSGTWRAGLNYRNQWQSVTVPWRTYDLYGDMKLLDKEDKPVYFGAGLIVARDKAGDGDLGTTKVLASGAVHVKLKKQNSHTLSAGVQLGYVRKSIDWNKLYFNSQWNDQAFDQSLPQFENYKGSGIGYPDLAAGLVYSNYEHNDFNYYASASIMHLIKPHESFYKSGDNNLGFRPVIGAGGTYVVGGGVSVSPSVHYMSQKKASELMAGIMLGYDISGAGYQRVVVYGGAYNRMKDAFYPTVGLDYGPWRGFINYDVNYSQLKVASGGRGAFELSLAYTGGMELLPRIIDIPCPRF